MIWSSSTIARFTNTGEQEIAQMLNCLIARYSVPVLANTPTYALPLDVLSIRRVTWLGRKKYPLPAREYHNLNVVQVFSEPIFYVPNQQGRNTIRFHPIPSVSIAAYGGANINLFGPEIPNRVIVEYYQLPDSITTQLPHYIRRRLIKYYVLKECFAQEGNGQNLKVAAKMEERFNFYMGIFRKIHSDHFIAEMNTLGQGNKVGILAPPRLSYKFGEPGEF